MKRSQTLKFLTVVSLTILIASGLLLWRWDDENHKAKMQALESELHSQTLSLSLAATADIKNFRRSMLIAMPGALDWKPLKPALAMATVQYDAAGTPAIVAWAADPRGEMAGASGDSLLKLIQEQKSVSAVSDQVLARSSSFGGKKQLLLLIPSNGKWNFMWLGSDWLQPVMDQLRGYRAESFLVTDDGLVFSHSVREYAGTTMSEPSIWGSVTKTGQARGAGVFKNGDKDSYAVFDRVAGTPFIVISQWPDFHSAADSVPRWLTGLGIVLGALLLGGGALVTMLRRQNEDSEARVREAEHRARTAAQQAAAVKSATVPSDAGPSIAPTQKEKTDAYMKIASALGHELRAPMMSILGQAQIALSRSGDAHANEPLEAIVRESRSAREILDKLFVFAGEAPPKKEKLRIEAVLAPIFAEMETKFAQKHVKVVREVMETSPLELDAVSMSKALKGILTNAVEAMERMPKKEIRVALSENTDEIRLTIADSGEGIDAADLSRVCDPFFTTRGNSHLGLGLPVVLGVVKEHGGELKIESQRGQGTKIVAIFPKKKASVEIMGRQVELTTEETVIIPKELPRVAEPKAAAPATPPPDAKPRIPLASDAAGIAMPSSAAVAVEKASEQRLTEADSITAFTLSLKGDGGAPATKLTDVNLDSLLDFSSVPGASPKKVDLVPPASALPAEDKTVVLGSADAAGHVMPDMGSYVQGPKFKAPERTSKLDEFRADVRRPGAGKPGAP